MPKLQYIILLMAMFVSTKNVKAQIPVNDPGWVINTAKSDDFNGTSLNTSKWWIQADSTPGQGLEMMYYRNIKVDSGSLKIKADTLRWAAPYTGAKHTPYHYQSGCIISYNTYQYGYIELNAKLPTGNSAYWPALWFWQQHCDSINSSNSWYEELDLPENGGLTSLDGHEMQVHYHWSNSSSCENNHEDNYMTTGLPQLNLAFHKYAVEWDTTGLKFYFDDVLVKTYLNNNPHPTNQHAMEAILDFFVEPGFTGAFSPAVFEIDYVHYYKLTPDCNTNTTICTPADYDRKVKKTIVTNSACTPTFNTSDDYTLRATDYIILNAGTTINPNGSGQFTILPSVCPN